MDLPDGQTVFFNNRLFAQHVFSLVTVGKAHVTNTIRKNLLHSSIPVSHVDT